MFFGKPIPHWNEKDSKRVLIAVGLVQIYLDHTARPMKCRVFEMYPVHSGLLNFTLMLINHEIHFLNSPLWSMWRVAVAWKYLRRWSQVRREV